MKATCRFLCFLKRFLDVFCVSYGITVPFLFDDFNLFRFETWSFDVFCKLLDTLFRFF